MQIANYIDPMVMANPHIPILPKELHHLPANVGIQMEKMNVENIQNSIDANFAMTQWLKLAANAEGLFNQLLVSNKLLNEHDRICIEDWMCMKQECEECLCSAGLISNPRILGPIQETDESDESSASDEDDGNLEMGNSTFDDSESEPDDDDTEQNVYLEERISELMITFTCKMNEIIDGSYDEFIKAQPTAVISSYEQKLEQLSSAKTERLNSAAASGDPIGVVDKCRRRKSIQPDDSGPTGLSSVEIDHLRRVADESARNNQTQCSNNSVWREATKFLENSNHMHPLRMANGNKVIETLCNDIRRIQNDIDSKERDIEVLKHNITEKQRMIDDLINPSGQRVTAKRHINRLESNLMSGKERCKKLMANSMEKKKIEELQMDLFQIEKELNKACEMKEISRDSDKRIKRYQKHVQDHRKELNALREALKKDRKLLEALESKLKHERSKNAKEEKKSTTLANVDTRITQLDCVLKEKGEFLQKNSEENETVESIRHEIRNLRSQRERLNDAQCALNQKSKKEKGLTEREARQILEYDVAKEVIDHAMEFKNQLICGRDGSNKNTFFVGNSDLMNQLSRLNEKEMRILLYKCFQKIVDLRESSRQLEIQLLQLERERYEWGQRERALFQQFQQFRLEKERHTLHLQRQYEATLTKLLQKAGEDCETSSSMSSDSSILLSPFRLIQSKQRRHHHAISNEIEFGIHDYGNVNQQQRHAYRIANAAVATTSKQQTAEPIDSYQKQKHKQGLLKTILRKHGSSSVLKRDLQQQLELTNHVQMSANHVHTPEGRVTVFNKKIIIQQTKK